MPSRNSERQCLVNRNLSGINMWQRHQNITVQHRQTDKQTRIHSRPNNSTKQLVTRVNSTHHRHIQLHILDVILDIDSAQFTTASRRSVRVKTRGTNE